MFMRLLAIACALKRAGEPKLSRGMERIELKCALKCGDGLFLFSGLRKHSAQKVKDVGILRLKLSATLERFERLLRVPLILVDKSDVVPGARVAGSSLGDSLQHQKCRTILLQAQQSDALIHPGCFQFRIKQRCSLEKF